MDETAAAVSQPDCPSTAPRWHAPALAIGGAVAYALSFPPLELGAGVWLAALLWLALIGGSSSGARFRWMFISGYLATALVVQWLTALFSVMALFLWIIPALYFALWGLVAGLWQHSSSATVRVLWPAITIIAMEYIRGEVAPLAFTFGTLGSSQINLVGAAVAGVIGMYGVAFVVVLVAGLVLHLLRGGGVQRIAGVGLALAIATLTALPPLHPSRAAEPLLIATLHQVETTEAVRAPRGMGDLASATPTDLSIWPELFFQDDPRESDIIAGRIRAEAALTSAGVIVGAIRYTDPSPDLPENSWYNAAFYYDAHGHLVGTAAKNQPIPFFSDGLPAPGVTVFDVVTTRGVVRAGTAVCYDGSFQKFARRMVLAGADLLIFPTMNMQHWGARQHRQHQRLFQMRAAETGRSVLVAAVNGPTMHALPGGAIDQQSDFTRPHILPVQPVAPHSTLYMRGGWQFAPFSVAVVLAGTLLRLLTAIWGRLREKPRVKLFS